MSRIKNIFSFKYSDRFAQYPESVDAPGIAGVVDDGSGANPESIEIVDQSRPSRNDRE
jgi:hypothetical protein